MKKNNRIINNSFNKYLFMFFLISGLLSSCDEKDFLTETPLDFYSPENSYVSFENFDAALINLHDGSRDNFYIGNWGPLSAPRIMFQGTDLVMYNQGISASTYASSLLVPESRFVWDDLWRPAYIMIYDANVILNRLNKEQCELTEAQKVKVEAEAKFFRGFYLNMLANLYGGVPIVLEETSEPKRDYVRASRQEVYEQCASDLKFASENLSEINETADFRVSNLAAYHVLSEVYISLGQYDNAIEAASKVIDHPSTALMTERFGTRLNDEYNPNMPWASGGDVYWDLFRKGNQNRSVGNTEALWVLQFEYNVDGGADGGSRLETNFNPRNWRFKVYNNNGQGVNIIPSPNSYFGGRAAGQVRLSNYFYHELWEKSGYNEDIRNADHNIIRDFIVNNPASEHFGKWILADNLPIKLVSENDTLRDFFPVITKISSMGDHPQDVWLENQTVPGSISSQGGPTNTTYRHEYKIRLAETYFLRAEAYLAKGDQVNAAKDINVVRQRAQAPNVNASDVDLDYILDERLRELYIEEFRLITLARLGKLVERTNKYSPIWAYQSHQNLWPIPFSEIEKNIEAELEQNPGY